MKHRAGSSGGNGKGASNSASLSSAKGGKGGHTPKGKGKGGASGNGGGGAALDLKEVPLHLTDYLTEDHEQKVPRYHAVLRRAESDGVTLEDIDPLQLELESLLAMVVLRKQSIKDEVKVLNNADKYKGQAGKASLSKRGGPSSPGKRGASNATSRNESGKRFKAAPGGKPAGESSKILGLPKVRSEHAVPHFDPLQNEQIRPLADTPKPSLPKNETPNRFWAFVEPYCAPISPEDIKLLEDLIRTHNDLSEYFRIPPLGQHYTQRWAKEDLENERQKSAVASADNSGSETAKSGDESSRMLKKAESADEKTPFGEMTQRLVAGLMEENIMTSVEDSIDAKNKGATGSSEDTNAEAKSQLIKSLNIAHSDSLEARVRKELEEQGVLDPNDDNDEDNDEILEELKRCQGELKAVSMHNLHQLKRLLKAAKEELVRQELRNKLAEADAEVMDAYQKISAARSKKKPPTKKERETAWKALKEREVILKELERT